ncbi:ATPase domain-containing protein [Fodinibius sp. SL11]|uniref:ATPase domain-containing protein n=1 Tax=Fodinibius sp. SL11 TaxID=3425690 RepID=UPI003F885E0B
MNDIDKISTGLEGLDEILQGGLIPRKAYLVQGGPGSGKSTLGFHFLRQAIDNGENALCVTMVESKDSIYQNASRFGIDLSEVAALDLSPQDDVTENSGQYNVFSSAEVEQGPIMESVIQAVEKHSPSRVLFDSFTMLRLLNQDPYQMRKLTLSLVNYITKHDATLMMTSESLTMTSEDDAAYWVDCIIELENDADWRNLKVPKFRGSDYLSGNHAFKITGNGITVFPRLRPNNYNRKFTKGTISSGINGVDKMLNGGIEKGTTSLIIGPTGVGKTNLGLQFAKEAALRNERSAVYTFEESKELIVRRSENINTPINDMIDAGYLNIVPVEPLSYSPDEFAKIVRRDVEENDTQIVVIDAIGGYRMAVRGEDMLERLHSLTVYLQNMGVTTFLLNETKNVTGQFTTTNMNASYLADNIIFLRYLEVSGQIQKAIGILKKRLSGFEKSIREFEITSEGVKVGQTLDKMRGILSGVPEVGT